METTLHRQLKAIYSPGADQQEVQLDSYRIDAIADGRLIEIQHGSLGAIRDKIRDLLEQQHDVHVVKPLAARKYLVKRKRAGGKILSARYSPLRATRFDLFTDLVHFVNVFPHPRLTLEVLLTEQEEHRIERVSRRRRGRNYRVEDRVLRSIDERWNLRTVEDLTALLPAELPDRFTTAELADGLEIPRWLAQKMAYCLRQSGAVEMVGKQGNSLVYECAIASGRAAA